MSKIKCDESYLQYTTSVCMTKCPYIQEIHHLRRVTLKRLSDRDVYLWTWILVLPLIGHLCNLSSGMMYVLWSYNVANILQPCTAMSVLSMGLILFVSREQTTVSQFCFGQPRTQTWVQSQALFQNELVHPLSKEEQAQLTWTTPSRHADNAKFGFLNLQKSSNTNSTGPGLSNASMHSCVVQHRLLASGYRDTNLLGCVPAVSLFQALLTRKHNESISWKRSIPQSYRASQGEQKRAGSPPVPSAG